ncbi:MAG: histidine phosphatase family protein [Clostridiales bacterium]|nr:histidine phosphatase family protein [Clostridiales bacterium]
MKNYTIYVIRHGLTRGNEEGRYIGHTDLPLSGAGAETLRKLRISHPYPEVDAVFSSPLKRCTASAKLLYPNRNPIVMDELIEYNFGEFETLRAEDLQDNADFSAWLQGGVHAAPPHGESNAEFSARICSGFEKLVDGMLRSGTQRTAIIGHAGVLMTILAAYGLPEAPMNQWMMDAGYGYELRITPGLWMRGHKVEVTDTCPVPMPRDSAAPDTQETE